MTSADSGTAVRSAPDSADRRGKRRRRPERSAHNLRYLARSIVLEEMGPPRGLRQAVWVMVLAVLCFIAWAAVTPLAETARAPGQVVPQGSVMTVQHLEGGIVAEIKVEDGTIVEPGMAMVRLDETTARGELEEKSARITALSLEAERLRAFADDRAPDFSWVDARFTSLATDQMVVHKLQTESRKKERAVLQSQIDQRRSELSVLEQQETALMEQVKISSELADMREQLMKNGHVSRVVYLRTKQELSATQGELRRIQGEASKALQTITEAEGKLLELDAKRNNEAATRMSEVSTELEQLRRAVTRLEDRMARTTIRAPVKGVVKGLQIHTVGGVVPPGGVISEIVPIEDELVIEARVSPTDIGHIEKGQKAKIVVTTYDFARFGSVDGVVDKISATTFLDDKGAVYYKAVIRLTQSFVGSRPSQNPIVPGMITEVAINTGNRTFLSYLIRPVVVAAERAFGER
jgi:HlyD family secretion protein/adhesin transport system membrane fusion protein